MNDRRNFQKSKSDYKKQNDSESYNWLKDNIPAVLNLTNFPNIEMLLNHIKSFVENQCGNLSASQLRNIFSRLKARPSADQIQLSRVKIVYAAARQTLPDARNAIEFFEKIASEVKSEEQAKNFIAFLEAVVAYHKFFFGKKSQ